MTERLGSRASGRLRRANQPFHLAKTLELENADRDNNDATMSAAQPQRNYKLNRFQSQFRGILDRVCTFIAQTGQFRNRLTKSFRNFSTLFAFFQNIDPSALKCRQLSNTSWASVKKDSRFGYWFVSSLDSMVPKSVSSERLSKEMDHRRNTSEREDGG